MSDDTTDPGQRKRFFTPAEANELLPEIASRITEIGDRLRRARTLTDSMRLVPEGSADAQRAMDDIEAIRGEVERLVEEIHREGVEVKSLSPGLLDFPAVMNGQEVYLCWKEGEGQVSWWHPLHTGIAGRNRLDPRGSASWEWCN